MTNDGEQHARSEEPRRKLRDDELDLVTGGEGATHHDLVITKVLDKASPRLFDAG
jgi:type VI protein secretion system component Hcp